MENYATTSLIESLYGERSSKQIKDLYDPSRGLYLPVQSSPFKEYVQDVNRFLFSGGIGISSYSSLPDKHTAISEINSLLNNQISPYLESIWENLAITGEIAALVRFNYAKKPTIEYFDKREFTVTYNKLGNIEEISIKTQVIIDNEKYVYKVKADSSAYYDYPLVKVGNSYNYDWDKSVTITEHNYGETPVAVIKVNPSINSKRGQSEFNLSSINLAVSIVFMEYSLDENVEFLGHPLLDSPDPRATIEALNNKIQVLQKLPADEGGGHSLIQPAPLTETELKYLEYKKASFKRVMGITNTHEAQLNDVSGAALRIMNDGLISKAQTKWSQIVEGGLEPLLNLVARMGHTLNLYNLASLYSTPIFKVARKQPYFSVTEQEKLQSLEVANRLIEMGVDRVHALKETYYTHLTMQEIESMLRVNLEDI